MTASSGSVVQHDGGDRGQSAPTVATRGQRHAQPGDGHDHGLSVLGADDAGESNLTYTWADHRHAAGGSQLQRQRQQRGQEHHGHLQRGGQLFLPGHDHRPRRADGHQQRQRDGEPDADEHRDHAGDRPR